MRHRQMRCHGRTVEEQWFANHVIAAIV
jgi:hypothetical protein